MTPQERAQRFREKWRNSIGWNPQLDIADLAEEFEAAERGGWNAALDAVPKAHDDAAMTDSDGSVLEVRELEYSILESLRK